MTEKGAAAHLSLAALELPVHVDSEDVPGDLAPPPLPARAATPASPLVRRC